MATLSIIGLLNLDPDLFRGFKVPGVRDITDDAEKEIRWIPDRQAAIDFILTACGELSLVYSDPTYMRYAIRSWTARRFPVWAALYNSTLYKYNPIWNVDGVEVTTRTLDEDINQETGENRSDTKTTVDDEDTTGNVSSTGSTDADIRGNVTAFDTNAYSPNDQQTQEIGTESNAEHSGTRDLTRTETGSANASGTLDRDRSEKETTEHVRHGNIGVTMTQQMIQAERDAVSFSLYDVIMQDFKHEFCVMVY